MKVRTKKGIIDAKQSINELIKAVIKLGETSTGVKKSMDGLSFVIYCQWKLTFKPQKQNIIWIIIWLGIILAIAEIIWYAMFKL